MTTKYKIEFDSSSIQVNLDRIINQVYRLLPVREEKGDWQKPLETLMVELVGMANLFPGQQAQLLTIFSKLEGMKTLTDDKDFNLFRRTIFESLGLLGEFKNNVGP